MSSNLRLQLVGPPPARTKRVVTSLSGASSLSELQAIIVAEFGVDVENQHIMVGFPPKPLEISEDSSTASLESLGICNGSSLAVQKSDKVSSGAIKGSNSASDVIFTIAKSGTGHMAKREMPADNSCLFHSVAYTCDKRAVDAQQKMRKIVADTVSADPRKWNTNVLGQHPSAYCQWIMNKDVWGGAIELQIFAEYFQSEIVSFDYTYLREDVFGEGRGFSKRVFLIYTGQHYDAMAWSPFGNAASTKDQVIFSTKDEYAWKRARDYVEFLHQEAVKRDSSLKLQKEWRSERQKRIAKGYSMVSSSPEDQTMNAGSESQDISSIVDGWNCTACTMRNNSGSSTCSMCGTAKPSSGILDNFWNMIGGSSTASQNSWSCKACTFLNPSSAEICEACNLPKH